MLTVPAITDYVAGDSMAITFTIRDETGARVNLTNSTLTWSLSSVALDAVVSPPVLIHSTLDGYIQFIDQVNGIVKLLVRTGDIPLPGDYIQELVVNLPTGESYTVARGTVRAITDIL